VQFQNIKTTKGTCKVIAGKAPNKSKHANFTKPMFEALRVITLGVFINANWSSSNRQNC